MAIRPSGREEMIAANRARARARGNQNRVSPSKVQNKTAEQASDAQNTSTNTNDGPTVFRYPVRALDENTDMLLIRIFSYKGDPSDAFGLDKLVTKETVNGKTVRKINPIPTTTSKFNDGSSAKFMKDARYIWLPIPQQVSDSLSVGYAEDTLNPLQAAGLSITKEAMDVGLDSEKAKELLSNMTNLASAALDTGTNGRTLDLMKTALSATAINQFGANVNPTSLVTRASGQILQSNLELLFSNVTLRSFPFTFDFAPRDDREAQEVKAIIRTMKRAMVPKRGDGVFINSPDLFQFEYVSGGKNAEHPFLNRFKVGVLTDLSVNYTASGTYATYYDGTPVHIRLACTLKEINPVYAEDYDDIGVGPNYGVGY